MYVTCCPELYVVLEDHAPTPEHCPEPVEVAEVVEVVEVVVLLVDVPVEPLTGHESALTASIQEAAASGYCQTMAPASHPSLFACERQEARVPGSIYPLLASEAVAGFPMTSLSRVTPLAAIWNKADSGHWLEEAVRRPEQVVYSVDP